MQQVVSVSLGSSTRDHKVEVSVGGQRFEVRREGTDGDFEALKAKLRQYNDDPAVAAIGLGGADLYLDAAGGRYWFREMRPLLQLVTNKALVDGGGLKSAVEADTVRYMVEQGGLSLAGKRVLCTSAVDRWGLAHAFVEAGSPVTFGDLLWAIDIPVMISSPKVFAAVIKVIAPIAVQLPFKWLYPSVTDHTTQSKRTPLTDRLYAEHDIIIGDYKFVVQYMPDKLDGKWIVTNTTTEQDVEYLRERGVEVLITTTPVLEGRSFGTNVMEALLIASQGSNTALEPAEYLRILNENNLHPSIQFL